MDQTLSREIRSCRGCGHSSTDLFFDLGMQPLANALNENSGDTENRYPLALCRCPKCRLVQLSYTIDPRLLFSRYVWMTASSDTAITYSESFFTEVIQRAALREKAFVLEVASNDGTFLKAFAKRGFRVLGVDPAENITQLSEASGVPVIHGFFGSAMAIDIVSEQGIPEILIARNVLPHVSDLHDFLEGLRTCMDNDTLLVIEVHDAGIICAELQYDSIYHEHLCYFTLETIESILHGHGLYLFDLIKSPISGGSMVLFVKNMRGKESVGLVSRKRLEARHLIDRSDAWGDFAQRCERHREQLIQLLQDEKERGRRIAGYGASARSSTLLNYCCIGNEILSAIADKNPLKQHRFTPGTGIRIDSPERVIREHIDTVLVLAWNFLDEISNYLRKELHFKGNIVSPFPNAPFFL